MRIFRRLRSKKGFTLIESIVATGILAAFFGVLISAVAISARYYSKAAEINTAAEISYTELEQNDGSTSDGTMTVSFGGLTFDIPVVFLSSGEGSAAHTTFSLDSNAD